MYEPVDGHPYLLYPPKAKARSGGKVTAIAGFRYATGAILCADSELNYGTAVKTHVNKISIFGNTSQDVRGALTGAGDWDDVQRVVQHVQARWPEILAGEATFDAVVDEKVKEIYGQSQAADWSMAIIAVVWKVGEKARIIKADDHKGIKPVPDFGCDGMGLVLSHYLAGTLYSPGITLYHGLCLASYILYVADAYAPFCGGLGNVFTLNDDGWPNMQLEWDMQAQREFFERFMPALRPIILEGPSDAVSSAQFDGALEDFVVRVRKLRKEVELGTYERAKKYGHLD